MSKPFSFEEASQPAPGAATEGFSFNEAAGIEPDGAFERGWNKATNAMAVSANMAIGDNQAAAERIKVASDYNAANPGSQESQELMKAWETGDGISGGFSEVGGEISKDWREASGLGAKLKSAANNVAAVGETLAEQTGNMVAPLVGTGVGHAAGRAVGTPIGAGIGAAVGAPAAGVGAAPGAVAGGAIGGTVGGIGGSILGGAIGNAAQESGYMALGDIQEAGIDPGDVDAVRAYLDENSGRLLEQGATKGAIIATVDRLTMGIGSKLLNGPLREATHRALAGMGVDAADKAAVKAATQSSDFAARLAGDAAYQSSKQGAERIARNMAAFAVDPAGEFTGEFVGTGVATGEWDAKDATLEAVMGLGQSGVMYAGQKAYQHGSKALGGIRDDLKPGEQVQPMPTADNPAPAPVDRPDPSAGPLSAAANLLPAPEAGNTLYGDEAGNVSGNRPSWVNPENDPSRQSYGPGMDRQASGPVDIEGEVVARGPLQQASAPAQAALPDLRQDAITVDAEGNAQSGKLPNTPPRSYVQVGRGMDQQAPIGQRFSNPLAAKNAISKAPEPAALEVVEVGPKQFEVQVKAPVLQNRDRSTPASITQMRSIAANPDYSRLGFSRDFANGAPVVEPGANVLPQALGRQDVATTGSGRKIPVQYAVVEAASLMPSHDVNGSPDEQYATGAKGKSRAIAGNGRVAGLRHAFTQGTAGQYVEQMAGDASLHGISPAAIRGMKEPVLVRIMPREEITQDIGDESNTTGVLALSGAEQAMNDARRISIDDMEFSESGEISETTVRQFVQSMPAAERNNLLDGSRPSRQAYDRAESAIFANAYESEALIRLQAQATDPEVRTVLSGLLVAAPKMARLKGAGAWDIRGLVVEAAEAAVNARRNGQTLEQFAQQIDLDRNPESQYFVELFAANIRSAKRIGEELSNIAELFYAESSKPEFDMLGAVPRRSRQELLNGATDADTASQSASAQAAGNQAGPGTAAPGGQGAGAQPAEPAGAGADARPESFQLDSYSEEELAAQAAAQAEAAAQAASDAKAEADKAQADKDRDDFALTGSDRPTDVATAYGQNDIFAPPTRGEKKAEQEQAANNVPAAESSASTSERQPISFISGQPTSEYLADGSTIEDGSGQQYRVHYQRNDLVIAHPIVDGKAQVNADSSVRFHVGDPASADGRRTDPIYLVEGRSQQAPESVGQQLASMDANDLSALIDEVSGEADAQRFIAAPDGSTDFGEITSDMAKAAGRQAGKIRLQQGNESWGLQHIEQRHGAEIRDAGFADVPAFVADIAQHIDEVWKPAATRQLVALHKVGNNRMMFVELQPGKDEAGDFYTVNTAFTSRKAEKKGWKLLWEARAQASGESGNRPSFAVSPPVAGGEVTNPSSQSSEPSIAPPAGDKLFATLETRETDLGVALFSRAGGPIDPAGLSESSMVAGKAPENPISLEQAISAAEQFLADYNGNIELSYRIRKTQYELYGPAGAVSEIGVVKGAYHPGRGLFTLTSDHLSSAADAHETLRHEILGHYGLDTFSPQDKQALLDKILASKEEPSLKPIWDDIAVVYADKSDNIQAEEVFARLAEGERSGKEKLADLIGSLLTRLLRKVLGYKKGVITRRELLREIEVISKGIRNGSRQRQTFESENKQRRGAQTETPAFKRWFGDSKVVDADGNPLVVYHGSPDVRGIFAEGFKGKSRGSVFFAAADYAVADSYADDRRAFDYQNAEPQTIPLYLAIKNPMVVDAKGAHWKETERHVSEAKAAGHDGIIIKNSVDFYNNPKGRGKTTTVYAWFAPEQAKSAVEEQLRSRVDRQPIPGATGNNGDFDPANPDIRYRLSGTDAKGIPLFSARAIAKKVMAATGLNATVVNTEADLPADLQAQIKRDKATGRVAGVYHNGTAYLVASNLRDTKHAISVMLHEAIGHGGVKSVLGDRIGKVMAEIYRDMPAAMRKELERRYAGQMASMSEADARVMIAEEYVAHLAETDPRHSIINRLVALLRQFIRDTFGKSAALKWTRNDLVLLLAEARTAARNGGRGPGGAARMRETAAADALAALPEVDAADESAFVASLKGDAATRSFANALYKARGTESPFFKAWFGKSRMVDKQGQPIAFVHRSYGERDTFTDADLGKNTGTPTAALGHYLARKDVGNVERYGPVVEQFYIRMEKPKVITQAQFEAMGDWSLTKVQAYRKTLMDQGHDGLYIQGLSWPVVFEGKNIKAKRNQGTFDATASTRYSLMSDAADLFTRFGQRPADPNDPFAEENRRLREQDKSLWDKAKREFRRQFAPGGLLPDAVFGEKVKRDSEFQAVEFDVRHLARGLERAIKADFGAAIDDLPDDQMKRLADALAGKVDPSLPEGTKVAVVAMRQYIDSLSAEYIGILQQQVRDNLKGADAALIEKIAGNIGSYVHRSYQAFDDPKWFQKVPTEVVNAARHYLANGYMEQGDSKKEAYERAEVKVNEMLKTGTAYDSMESFIAEGKLGAKDLSVLIKRKSIAPEIRALLGEYSDPRLNFAKSATKMGRLIWNQRFLDRVREDGVGVFLFEGKDRPAGATVQIAGEASDVYAPLNGLWTFPDVAQAFKDSLGKEQMSDLYRTIVRLNGMVKYGKTVLSPTTAMRNWQSAMFFSLANGHFDLTQMKHSWAALREQVTQNATGDDLTYLRKLKQLGVVYDTPYAGEMMALLNDARMDELLSGKSGAGFKWLRKINEVAQGFYSFGDDFWKIIGFENEKASLIKAGIPADQAEQMAAERIRNTYPTYSMVGKGINWLRRFPLAGTFVSFPAEIIRTSVNMLQLTAADLKSDNPGLQAIGRKRVVGMAMVSAGFYALAAMTAAAFGVGDDEEEAIRDLAAPWQRNSTFLYTGRDADGKLRYFDMSFLDPYGYWKRPLTAMLRDQPWEKAAASGIGDMLSPFLGTDIAAGAIFEVLANKKASGGQVYQEGAGAVDQTTAIADHLRKALQPGFVSNAERLLLAGQGARREGSGQPYDMRDEVVSLLGWRTSTLDTQTALYYRSFEFTDGLRDASKVLNRTLSSSNKVSDGDIRSARETAQTQYDQAFKEMGRLVNSARAAGMSNQQIAQTLRSRGVSQVNVMALLAGRVPPMNAATLQGQVRAVQLARMMQGSEHAQEIARRFAVARQL